MMRRCPSAVPPPWLPIAGMITGFAPSARTWSHTDLMTSATFAIPRLPAVIATVWPGPIFRPRSSVPSWRWTSAVMSATRGASNRCRMRSIRGNALGSCMLLLLQNLFHGCERAREIVLRVRGREIRLESRGDVDAVANLLVPEPHHAGLVAAQRVAMIEHGPVEIFEPSLEEHDPHAAVPLHPNGLTVPASDGLDALLVPFAHLVQPFQRAGLLQLVQRGEAGRCGDRV